MQKRTKFYIATEMQHMAAALGLSARAILRRADLPEDYFDHDDPGLAPDQLFALWEASAKEYNRPDYPLMLGKMLASGNAGPIILAFTCSHTVAEGFERIALFKPLAGPLKLETNLTDTAYTVSLRSSIPGLALPSIVAAMDLVFFVELLRITTGEHVIPTHATLPERVAGTTEIEQFIGIPIEPGETISVTFTAPTAALPLVTENEALWTYYEQDLTRKLAALNKNTPTTDRLRATLRKMLPSGKHTAAHASQRLGLSKRSLQRQLTAEGTTYQTVLDTTRSELSLHYLRKHDMSVDEIIAQVKGTVGDKPVYVTFDIDCLDPAFAPGTGTPVCGGLNSDKVLKIIRGLQGINMVGMDVVEVSPAYDQSEITALAGATIALELLYVWTANRLAKS